MAFSAKEKNNPSLLRRNETETDSTACGDIPTAAEPLRSGRRKVPTSSGRRAAPQPFSKTRSWALPTLGGHASLLGCKQLNSNTGHSNRTLEVQMSKCISTISQASSIPTQPLVQLPKAKFEPRNNCLENSRDS